MAGLIDTLRSRWLTWAIHGGLWGLLALTALRWGGRTPAFRGNTGSSQPAESPAPVARLTTLFASTSFPTTMATTNSTNPFYTTYFIPAPSPAPPPPPTSRKVDFTYQGYFETEGAPPNAIVKMDENFVITTVGRMIAQNLFVAQASMQTLLLTNANAQTNLLQLNVKKEIEVPIK